MTKPMRIKEGAFIPASKLIAEWRKDPKYMEAYDALEDEFAEIRQQMLAKRARRQRRAMLLARLHESARGFWHWLTRGVTRLAPS